MPHLGCEHNCVFCNQKRISGEERPARAEDVRKATAGFEDCQVAFYGGSFTAVPASMQEELLGAAEGHSIRLSTRPDAIDEAVLSRLKRFNVETVELGAQSLDDEVRITITTGGDLRYSLRAVVGGGVLRGQTTATTAPMGTEAQTST